MRLPVIAAIMTNSAGQFLLTEKPLSSFFFYVLEEQNIQRTVLMPIK